MAREYACENSRLTTIEQVLAISRAEKEMADLEREDRWISEHGDKAKLSSFFWRNSDEWGGGLFHGDNRKV